ncbi:uncharacterized protein LOC143596190 isoform X1 [Bidens hawaiensis]|uniref:uncharacterized protein LOC143596190 isoform X1 n=1 Tax=Bidens hawaiensis TaxID=980011 RepID=UPI004049BAE8
MQKGGSCQYSAPKKFSKLSDTVKFASTPRKLRSALEKRHHGSQKTGAPATPDSRKEMDGSDWRLKDCKKKHKTAAVSNRKNLPTKKVAVNSHLTFCDILQDGYNGSKKCLVTKDEEEAAQALFALAQTITDTCLNKATEVEPTSMETVPLNEAEVTDVKNVSHKRCLIHVYICQFIKVVQESEGGHVNVISDINSICSH